MNFDVVEQPEHYNTCGGEIEEDGRPKYEVIKIIDAWGLGFSWGNALKYILRSPLKGKQLQDLSKAQWYLDHVVACGDIRMIRMPSQEDEYSLESVLKAWSLTGDLAKAVEHIHSGNPKAASECVDTVIEMIS